MEDVSQKPNEYFTFNDSYFMAKLHEYLSGRIMHPMIRELSEMLAQRRPPAQIKIAPAQPTLIQSDEHRQDLVEQFKEAVNWISQEMIQVDPEAWLIFDIPGKDVQFTKNMDMLKKDKSLKSPLLARDPVKVLSRDGELRLLIETPNAVLKILSGYRNFLPRIYVSPETYKRLDKKGALDQMRKMDFSKPKEP